MSPDLFLSLEGDIQMALISLSSIVSYDESSGEVTVLHASLVDFYAINPEPLCCSTLMWHVHDAMTFCTEFFNMSKGSMEYEVWTSLLVLVTL